MSKFLITGGAGFIGRNIAARLLKNGHEVVILDRLFGDDLGDREIIDQNVAVVDQVIHLAAIADLNFARQFPDQTFKTNIEGTWNIAEFCAKHNKRLLFASTCCVYGDQDFEKYPETTEEAPPNPNEIYAYSKFAGEQLIKSFAFTHDLKYVLMRFATIYGEPGMREALGVKKFFLQAMANQPITVHGSGTQTRTLTYVDDLVDAVVALTDHTEVNNLAINLSAEESISANTMADKIKQITDSISEVIHIDQRPGQTMKEAISAKKAKDLIGWEAKTDFDTGLELCLAYYKRTKE